MSTASNIELDQISHVILYVSDLQKSRDFYTDKLGIDPDQTAHDPGWYELLIGDTRISLQEHADLPQERPEGMTELSFAVEDVDRAYEALRERGVEFIDEPHEVKRNENIIGRTVQFRDPDNNVLALFSTHDNS